MSSAVLDRVEALQEQEVSNRDSAWLELVRQFVDDELPAPDKVARIFRDTGKGRKDLERDGALLWEHHQLEAQLATIPELQRKADELGQKFSAALRAKEAAEVALKQAHEALSKADSAHNIAVNAIRQTRHVRQQLNDPRFNFLKGMERLTVRGQDLKEQITAVEGRLESLASRIDESNQNLSRYEAELQAVNHWDEKTEVKNVERTKLHTSIEGANNLINRYGDDEHDLRRELRLLRKELAAEKSNFQ